MHNSYLKAYSVTGKTNWCSMLIQLRLESGQLVQQLKLWYNETTASGRREAERLQEWYYKLDLYTYYNSC